MFTEKRIISFLPTLYLVLLFLIPTLIMIFIGFREPGDYSGVAPLITHDNNVTHIGLTLDSFKFAFSNSLIWQIFFRSMIFSIVTTIFCLILGYPLAMLIARSNKKIRDILVLMVIIPFWSSFLVRVYAWMIILGPDSGVNHIINKIVVLLGFPAVNILYSSFAVVVCLIYINVPFMILPLYANLQKHDHNLIEASRDLGATRLQSFLKITLPLSLPGVIAGSALVFIPSIGMFVVPELVGNNNSLMIGNLIKQQFLQTQNWPLGSVTSIIMTMAVIGITLLSGFFASRLKGLKYANK